MIITLVVDQYAYENNGTTISTRRFARALAERGHEVRVVGVTGDKPAGSEILYNVPERNVPLATYFAHKQGLLFAKADKQVLTEAITGSDVVHVLMPFKIEKAAIKIAKSLKIPVTGAFHVQAENVTTQLGLQKCALANKLVYKVFKNTFYKNVNYIHCPSKMIANELKSNGYKAECCVISNGIIPEFHVREAERPKELVDKFLILSIGRLSKEKRHDVLIDAIAKSKYANKIQLVIAGKGPIKDQVVSRGEKLPNKPIINFFSQSDLNAIINYSDLYVHPADIEIEAISCVEALTCGIVPIISNNPKCATQQFAVDDRSIFEHGNSDQLAEKIDYFIEHPEEKAALSNKYIEESKEYSIEKSIDKIENMFIKAIKDNN